MVLATSLFDQASGLPQSAVYHGRGRFSGNHYLGSVCPIEQWTRGHPWAAAYRCSGSGLTHDSEIRTDCWRIRPKEGGKFWTRAPITDLAARISPATRDARIEHEAAYASLDEVPFAGQLQNPGLLPHRLTILRVRGCSAYRRSIRHLVSAAGLSFVAA